MERAIEGRDMEQRGGDLGRDEDRWQRWAAATGIGFVVLALIGFLVDPSPPKPGDEAGEILSHFRDNDARVLWQALLFGLSGVLYLWFFGTLASYLRAALDDIAGARADVGRWHAGARYAAIVIAGAATSAALFLLGTIASATLGSRADDISEDTANGIFAIGNMAFAFTNFPAAAAVGAVTLAALRTRAFPDWLAWVGAAVAALLLINAAVGVVSDAAAFESSGWFGILTFLAFLAWTALTSWVLMTRVADTTGGRRAMAR